MPVPRFRSCRQPACARRSRSEEAGLERNRSSFQPPSPGAFRKPEFPSLAPGRVRTGPKPDPPRLALLRKSKLPRERSPSRPDIRSELHLPEPPGPSRKGKPFLSEPVCSLTTGANPICSKPPDLMTKSEPFLSSPPAAIRSERTPTFRRQVFEKGRTRPHRPFAPSRPKQASALPPPDPRSKGSPPTETRLRHVGSKRTPIIPHRRTISEEASSFIATRRSLKPKQAPILELPDLRPEGEPSSLPILREPFQTEANSDPSNPPDLPQKPKLSFRPVWMRSGRSLSVSASLRRSGRGPFAASGG